ncbi:hypothetical protein ABTK28_21675, partial [Acinetobacter baumannii]
ARRAGRAIECFHTGDQLRERLCQFSKDAEFYIDVNLANDNNSGVEVAHLLFEKGFKNIFLTTGYRANNFEHFPWIQKVLGKA